jgi:hypothetical protein
MDTFEIIWKNSGIGRLENITVDMWYWEGEWISNESHDAIAFKERVSKFDPKTVIQDPLKGTWIILKSGESDIYALVISLTKESLFLRTVLEKEAIEWLVKNVS